MKFAQKKQLEWFQQWSIFQNAELSLFKDWIYPNALSDFYEKEVLEAGCGGGEHSAYIAPYAKHIMAVDLNTITIAAKKNKSHHNIEYVEDDIGLMNLNRQFDVVMSIGVIHHTDDPNRTVANLLRHVKVGGVAVFWVYAKEGNFLVEYGVEPLRRLLFSKLPRSWLYRISQIITALLIPIIYTIYCLPVYFLPYYEYFTNFRKLSFRRNVLNVFDKLNAPQVKFIPRKQVLSWFPTEQFEILHLSAYCGVSWRVSAKRK